METKKAKETKKTATAATDQSAIIVSRSTIPTPFVVGMAYYFRTVTYHLTGRVKAIVGSFLVIEDAAWIADSGRFTQAINDGKLNEVEPMDVDVIVNTNSITDAPIWKHELPRIQK